ncbi:MAG: hypothetical protein ACLQU2_04995 [Candidatus Binataceae bacterium]
MAIIQEWLAEASLAGRRIAPIAGAAALLALLVLGPSGFAQQIGRQGASTLELPPISGKQRQTIPQAPAVPMQPGQNVLVIPRASRDFVGEWGGHLRLTRVLGGVGAAHDSIVGLAFGESNGNVFLQTTAFASRSSQILKTSADVVNPKTVKLKLKGLEMAFNPPILHKEELHLALTGKNTMNCLKYVDFYGPDSSTPIASMAYEGNLHLLSDQERRELEAQVLSKGQVPQKQIEGSRRFGP